jgi:hypothetical protein
MRPLIRSLEAGNAPLGLALALALALPAGLAAFDGAAGTAAPSLLLPVEARAVGMGSAYVAVASGVDSIQWNPAGMNQLAVPQAEAGHLSWVQDVNDEYLGAAFPIYGLGAWGLAVSYLYTQDQYYDNLGNRGGTFTDADLSAKIGMSFQLADDMNLGFVYKILRQDYATQFDMGSGFDLGWQWRDLGRFLDLGFTAQNLGTPVGLGGTQYSLPITLKAGAATHLGSNLLLAVDDEFQPIDSFNFIHVGAETSTRMGDWIAALRAGYTFGPAQEDGGLAGLTVGLGLGFGPWQVDYAYAPQGDLGQAQRLTLTWNAGD